MSPATLPEQPDQRVPGSPPYTIRHAVAADTPFLLSLYRSTREDELAAWGWDAAQADAFVHLQFTARQAELRRAFPGAEYRIVCCDAQPIGQLIVARMADELRLVDIALLPAFRCHGIGSALLRGVLDEARQAALPVRLSVLRSNPARRLYERLGFVVVGQGDVYVQMERRDSPSSASPARKDAP